MALLMYLDVDVQATGAHRLLDGIGDRLDDPERLLSVLSEDLQEYEQDVFDSRGRGTWAPNDPMTVALKGNGRVLVDNGGLLDELTSDAAISVRGETLTLQSSSPVAGYLKRGARGMPKRDPVPPPESGDVRDWADQLAAFIVDGHRR